MPKGSGRPFNKDLKKIAKSKLYKGTGLAGEVSKAQERNRQRRSEVDELEGHSIRMKQRFGRK